MILLWLQIYEYFSIPITFLHIIYVFLLRCKGTLFFAIGHHCNECFNDLCNLKSCPKVNLSTLIS